jgi:predicted nucleotidyltransferase
LISSDVDQPLQNTLADAVEFLENRGVSYALIGGLAASLRGQPRATADVDIVAIIEIDAALAIAGDLDQTAFDPLFSGINEVIQRAFILPLRHRATRVKVDIALGLSGFERQAVARATRITIAGRQVATATAEDLIIMKSLAARPQDQQDLAGIIAAQHDRLDWDYCIRVATELGEAVGQDLAGQVRRLRTDAGGHP